jgi:repressor LexA
MDAGLSTPYAHLMTRQRVRALEDVPPGHDLLTERQREVYLYIRRYYRQFRESPTRQQIQGAFGFRSPNAAQCHVEALIRKGALAYEAGKSRGIIPQGIPTPG